MSLAAGARSFLPTADFWPTSRTPLGRPEIWVRPFPNVEEGQWQISRDGGARPLWAPNGRELLYLAPGTSTRLMAVDVHTKPGFFAGNPKLVFEGPYSGGPFGRTYDISPDGKRFLMIKENANDETSTRESILVQNWFSELKRSVPADNREVSTSRTD